MPELVLMTIMNLWSGTVIDRIPYQDQPTCERAIESVALQYPGLVRIECSRP